VIAPRKRPFHTIIPGFVMKDGAPLLAFGLMGGAMQAQGHVQVLVDLIDLGANLQAASDAARFQHFQATDALALETARLALERSDDAMLLPMERLFLYLPFEHSEALEDQNRAGELTKPLAAFPETEDAYRYALAHRDVIQRFGRFPHRNSILGRASTAEELEFLKQPGSSF